MSRLANQNSKSYPSHKQLDAPLAKRAKDRNDSEAAAHKKSGRIRLLAYCGYSRGIRGFGAGDSKAIKEHYPNTLGCFLSSLSGWPTPSPKNVMERK